MNNPTPPVFVTLVSSCTANVLCHFIEKLYHINIGTEEQFMNFSFGMPPFKVLNNIEYYPKTIICLVGTRLIHNITGPIKCIDILQTIIVYIDHFRISMFIVPMQPR